MSKIEVLREKKGIYFLDNDNEHSVFMPDNEVPALLAALLEDVLPEGIDSTTHYWLMKCKEAELNGYDRGAADYAQHGMWGNPEGGREK